MGRTSRRGLVRSDDAGVVDHLQVDDHIAGGLQDLHAVVVAETAAIEAGKPRVTQRSQLSKSG